MKNYSYLNETHSKFITATAAILGIDSLDGTIDTVPALLSSLGITLSESALGVLHLSLGALATVALIGSALHQINKYELEQKEYLENTIIYMKEKCFSSYIEVFDEIIERFREELDNRLCIKYELDVNFHRIENLKLSVNEVDQMVVLMREKYLEQKSNYGV